MGIGVHLFIEFIHASTRVIKFIIIPVKEYVKRIYLHETWGGDYKCDKGCKWDMSWRFYYVG